MYGDISKLMPHTKMKDNPQRGNFRLHLKDLHADGWRDLEHWCQGREWEPKNCHLLIPI